MANLNQSYCGEVRRMSSFKESLNHSYSGSPAKAQLNKSIKSLFASFGLAPPSSVCRSGSSNALWFSTKFEKKMAAMEEDIPSSPLTRFQRDVPIRQSKLNSGPFRATQIWNEVIEHLKEKVELKRRRYKLRTYDDSFTGTDAVDVVLHYLLSDQDTFCNLSREKAVKLCQTLMDKHIFKPVGCKENDDTKHHFEDSNSKVYHFVGIHSTRDSKGTHDSESDEEMEGRDELCDTAISDDKSDLHTPQKLLRLNPYSDMDMCGDEVICNPMATTSSTHEDLTRKTLKRKQADTPINQHKRMKMSTSNESINQNEMSHERIQEIWKEIALCQLLTIINLSFVDGLLIDDKEKEKVKSAKKTKPCHNGIVSNLAAKNWSLKCTASSECHTDNYMRTALECIAHIPRGLSKFDTDFTKSCDPVTKLQAYNMIWEHYSLKMEPLFPERFRDLNLAIMEPVLSEKTELALNAMQLNMILLSEKTRTELRRLLKFMSAASKDTDLQLDRQIPNATMVRAHFTDCIFKHKGVAFELASSLTDYLIKNVEQIFMVPPSYREKVEMRIQEEKQGVVPVVEETVFCAQVTTSEFQRQTEECTNNGLVQMMHSIIDQSTMALKEKKTRLRQFRKHHPHLYAKHFAGIV